MFFDVYIYARTLACAPHTHAHNARTHTRTHAIISACNMCILRCMLHGSHAKENHNRHFMVFDGGWLCWKMLAQHSARMLYTIGKGSNHIYIP